MSHLIHADGTQPDNEYESQFVWNDDAQSSIEDIDDKSPPENGDDTEGKQKVDEKGSSAKKHSKKAVELKTQEDALPKSVKVQIRDRGEIALEDEAG
eukprot:15348695-Ditylum_brightwellii.AAC.2